MSNQNTQQGFWPNQRNPYRSPQRTSNYSQRDAVYANMAYSQDGRVNMVCGTENRGPSPHNTLAVSPRFDLVSYSPSNGIGFGSNSRSTSSHMGTSTSPTVLFEPTLPFEYMPPPPPPKSYQRPDMIGGRVRNRGAPNSVVRHRGGRQVPLRTRPGLYDVTNVRGNYVGNGGPRDADPRKVVSLPSGMSGTPLPTKPTLRYPPVHQVLTSSEIRREPTPSHIWDGPPRAVSTNRGPRTKGRNTRPTPATDKSGDLQIVSKDPDGRQAKNTPDSRPAETVSTSPREEETVQPLPYNLDKILAENVRMAAEEEKNAAGREQIEAASEADHLVKWPGDAGHYPAASAEDLEMPGCEYRAKAIHIGISPDKGTGGEALSVYAVRPEGSRSIEFRMAKDGSSPSKISQGPEVDYGQVQRNSYFRGMGEDQAQLWVRHLLATVPGQNDTIMKWTAGITQ